MAERADYQRLVNAGAIVDMDRLLHFATEKDLVITRVGSAHVTVTNAAGLRFRLFLATHEKARRAGQTVGRGIVYDFWIYALVAHTSTERACYIGQTRNVGRRMREHWKRRDGTRASRPLFDWATERSLSINATLLQALTGNQNDADDAEDEWVARATDAGFVLPGSEVWAPRQQVVRKSGNAWPSIAVQRNGRSLAMIASRVTSVVEIARNSELSDSQTVL
ncbi:hypothetical protein C0Z18_13020 [Trinickia dabaoshanensis]|uniref:GIY-YIG domain-containing protein n=1 Tax=Trinickia dabaoshanensis TaxID=564714 RepID=A0A2N7VRH2_9BURK|nr:GIY-YIG nuclease family protein [Trinickia dabaoshanensis]PMS19747.1 hypothetical protein C0Z18_13020 [Trinickia dabaoshanensis]TAM51874.1 MAG: GIY-YIG nuclease family protein [Paraburkholderia sp.]